MKKVIVVLLICIMVLGLAAVAQSAPYPETLKNLMSAVAGETQANANYLAFAIVADKEGRKELGAIFRVFADAELKHANDEFAIARGIDGSIARPKADIPIPGTTKQNLQSAVNGETFEYTIMYPEFITAAISEDMAAARRIFNFAKQAEEVHAVIYADLLANFDKFDKVKYEKMYRCDVCGFVATSRVDCPFCSVKADGLIEYEIVKKDIGCNAAGYGWLMFAFMAAPFVFRKK